MTNKKMQFVMGGALTLKGGMGMSSGQDLLFTPLLPFFIIQFFYFSI